MSITRRRFLAAGVGVVTVLVGDFGLDAWGAHVSAATMPVGNLDGWRQIFTDDFATAVPLGSFPEAVSGKWTAYPSPDRDTSKMGTYSPHRVVSVASGILTKHLHTEGSTRMVAAILPVLPRPQRYGRYSVCWRGDQLPGYKIAWLLWPDSDDQAEGEIDMPEMNLDAGRVAGFVHRVNGTPATQGFIYITIDTNEWHVDTIEWSPGLVVFLHDGREIYRTTEDIPDTPMHWVIQTEVAANLPRPPAASVAGDVQIAWVAAYAYDLAARAPLPSRYAKLVAPGVAVGTVALAVTSSPGIRQAKWMIDGAEIGWAGAPPFTHQWDSTVLTNDIYQISAKILDGTSWVNSDAQSITVANPRVIFTPPAVASGSITLSAQVPSQYVRQIKYVLDGRGIGSRSAAPWSMVWDTTTVANGEHVLFVKTLDDAWIDDTWHRVNVVN